MEAVVNKITITVIATKGCDACNIMTNIMAKVITYYKGEENLIFEFRNHRSMDKNLLKELDICDYPSVIITPLDTYRPNHSLNKELYTVIHGTCPVTNIIKAIEKYR